MKKSEKILLGAGLATAAVVALLVFVAPSGTGVAGAVFQGKK